jgi:beta-galactosidase
MSLRILFISTFISLSVLRPAAAVDGPTPQGPEVILSPVRSEIVLNGAWMFQPAGQAGADQPDAQAWGLIAVPGLWRNGESAGYCAMPGIFKAGTGESWNAGVHGQPRAWYQRDIAIPESWAGRRIVVDFQRVSTDAEVSVNGQKCGRVEWPFGQVDITSAVKPGATATLRVLVVSSEDAQESILWMGTAPGQNQVVKSEISAGISGDVVLRSLPAGPHVESLFVQPSFRKKQLDVDVDLAGVREEGTVSVTGHLLNPADGKEEKTFEAQVPVKAADAQTVRLSWPWENPRLWDVGKPELYTLQLEVKGAGLNDSYPQEFGFREIWSEGRDLFLNGVLFRPRPAVAEALGGESFKPEEIDGKLKGFLGAGFNIVQFWPNDHFARGESAAHRELWAHLASHLGVPLIGDAASMNSSVYDNQYHIIWENNRDTWKTHMEGELRHVRNEPSILIWGTSGNLFNQASDQDPRNIGKKNYLPASMENDARKAGDEGVAAIHQADPTRLLFVHAGNRVGDIYTTNNYLDLIPLQEREEWLSEFVKNGDEPYMAVEFGNPLHTDMHRGRDGFDQAATSEPWLTEFTAGFVGPDAYKNEESSYRHALRDKYQSDKRWQNWHSGNSPLNLDKNFQDLQSLLMRGTWRAWRTFGVSGMVAWNMADNSLFFRESSQSQPVDFVPGQRGVWDGTVDSSLVRWLQPGGGWKPLPAGETYLSLVHDSLAWIAGPKESFNLKDHTFSPSEKFEKSAVLINDAREPQAFTCQWSAKLGDKALGEGAKSGQLQPGEILFLPIDVQLTGDATGEGSLTLQAKIGETSHQDAFSFRVLAPATPAIANVQLWDPKGLTRALLEKSGIRTTAWNGGPSDALLVVGRQALSSGQVSPGDLGKFVEAGGRLLVMAQDPDWLRRSLDLRVSRFSSRNVFPIPTAPEPFASLSPDLLRDWRGESTLVEPRPPYEKRVTPPFGWRWGQNGVVSTASIEKPHLTGWRPLFECDFDLAYSPLMELDFGNGRAIVCSFDFEDHLDDPAAAELLQRIVTYGAQAPLAPRTLKAVYLGGEVGGNLLKSLGLQFDNSDALPTEASLVVIGEGAAVEPADLERAAAAGSQILVLADPEATAAGAGHFGAVVASAPDFAGFRGDLPRWPELRGLSLSDLHFRSEIPWPVIQASPGLEIAADGLFARHSFGKGVILYTQMAPNLVDAEKLTWLRFTRWRQTRALSQVLANLGASFQGDAAFFAPKGPADVPILDGEWKAAAISVLPAPQDPSQKNQDPGISDAATALVALAADESAMKPFTVPGLLPEFDKTGGEAVFRKKIQLSAAWAGQVLRLELGTLNGFNDVYLNGIKVEPTDTSQPGNWAFKRSYRVPPGVAKEGENVLAVRIFNPSYGVGFTGNAIDLDLRRLMDLANKGGLYHPDYWGQFDYGDEPYRYYRW